MHKNSVFVLLGIVMSLPMIALSQDARSILDTAQEKQLERLEGVDVYIVTQSIMGNETKTWFQRTIIEDDAGNSQTLFLPVRNGGSNSGQCLGPQEMTPEQLEAFAAATEMTGSVAAGEIENGLEEAGLPRGLLAASGSDPTATFDPRVMMGANAEFLRGAAQAKREMAAEDPSADGQEMADQMARFAENAKLVGTEEVDGRMAFHLQADVVGQVQQMEGSEYEMKSLSLWIDTAEYVPLRMKVDGTLTADGETKPMSIENFQSDYRTVPGSNMYESYKRVMKISGMMSAEQEAQMRDAAEQMAELEQQMASMPPSQRQMMEKMMGPQLEMMKNMTSGGGFQTEVITTSITVNPKLSDSDGQPCPARNNAVDGSVPDSMTFRLDPAVEQQTQSAAGLSKNELTANYLEGFWCTERMQERELYSFAADGSYRLGVVGLTITQADGVNYFPETFSRQSFLDEFESVATKEEDRFSVTLKGGSQEAFLRGNCFQ